MQVTAGHDDDRGAAAVGPPLDRLDSSKRLAGSGREVDDAMVALRFPVVQHEALVLHQGAPGGARFPFGREVGAHRFYRVVKVVFGDSFELLRVTCSRYAVRIPGSRPRQISRK